MTWRRRNALTPWQMARRRSDDLPAQGEDDPAKRAIIYEWENWAALNPDDLADPGADAFFYSHLQQKKPELLDFLSDDKRQTVSTWLHRQACAEG